MLIIFQKPRFRHPYVLSGYQKNGRPIFRPKILTPEEFERKFWSLVDIRGPDECWEWKGSRANGYGVVDWDKNTFVASRLALEFSLKRKLETGLHSLHSCDNPPCCNPKHLFEGTRSQNVQDCLSKGRFNRNPRNFGEKHHRSKLSISKVKKIRKMLKAKVPQIEIAEFTGMNQSSISRISTRKNWKQC